jgi:hypothetical protein
VTGQRKSAVKATVIPWSLFAALQVVLVPLTTWCALDLLGLVPSPPLLVSALAAGLAIIQLYLFQKYRIDALIARVERLETALTAHPSRGGVDLWID